MMSTKKKIAIIAVAGGVLIFLVKVAAYFISGSIALLSDAMESIVNIVASVMMLYAVNLSSSPADRAHQYGHEKVENISSLIEGVLIAVAAVMIFSKALMRLWSPVELTHIDLAIAVSLAATALNGVLSWGLLRESRRSGSLALEGDAKHILSDVLSSLAVVAGLFVARRTGWLFLDSALAMGVSIVLLKMAFDLVIKSSRGLMDESCPEEELKIVAILQGHHRQFVDFHNVRTRRCGNTVYAELHLSMRRKQTVEESHGFTEHIEDDVRKEMPHVRLNIHVEPPERRP